MKKEPDSLSKAVAMANEAGMSYGKWRALHEEKLKKKQKEKSPKNVVVRACVVCGKNFVNLDRRKRLYCSEECRASAEYAREQKKNTAKRQRIDIFAE